MKRFVLDARSATDHFPGIGRSRPILAQLLGFWKQGYLRVGNAPGGPVEVGSHHGRHNRAGLSRADEPGLGPDQCRRSKWHEDSAEAEVEELSTAELPLEPPMPSAVAQGWQVFRLEKTDHEKAEHNRVFGPPASALAYRQRLVSLPSTHESLQFTVSQGYVQGADWGTDTMGRGTLNGYETEFWSQTTMGPKGFEFLNGRFSATSPSGDWTIQGGDLPSDLWGIARGARFRWKSKSWHSPSLSFYTKNDRFRLDRNVVTFSDYVRVGSYPSISRGMQPAAAREEYFCFTILFRAAIPFA